MGGGLSHIVWLFGQEFAHLIAIAFVIVEPVGWYLMRDWLLDFEFSIPLDVWTFGLAVGSSLLIAALAGGLSGDPGSIDKSCSEFEGRLDLKNGFLFWYIWPMSATLKAYDHEI